jgi:hypothetical protein
MRTFATLLTSLIALSVPLKEGRALDGKSGVHSDVIVKGSVLEPRKLEASEAIVKATVKLPEGFALSVFARELPVVAVLGFGAAAMNQERGQHDHGKQL